MTGRWAILTAAALAITSASAPLGTTPARYADGPAAYDGTLSVLTYNIHGVPWPLGRDRAVAFGEIADRLRALRSSGSNPHVVVLQEAFTADAQALAAAAGYRYVANGPSVDQIAAPAPSHADRTFAAAARWWKGETEGKFVGSGLQIASDYPIVAVRRVAFPAFACAGFDCLANKGALLVSIAVPGVASPIDVVTTHLNSRHASRVPDNRSIYAYRRQVGILSRFIRAAHDPRHALIVAGDFNVGQAPPRRATLLADARSAWSGGSPVSDAFGEAERKGLALSADATFSRNRARDWQFFASGADTNLALAAVDVPFGHERTGGMLSDHIGYVARFRVLAKGALPAAALVSVTSDGQPKG